MTNEWTREEFGNPYNTYQERAAESELPNINTLMDAAGCPVCGFSGRVARYTGAGFRVEEKCPRRCRYTNGRNSGYNRTGKR